MDVRARLYSFVFGTVTSLVGSAILVFLQQPTTYITILLGCAFLFTCLFTILFVRKLHNIKQVGIQSWESTMSAGTSTLDCIIKSQKTVLFVGIASSKWVKEEADFRKMLMRHASNGGTARFLLMNPFSEVREKYENIKKIKPDTLSCSIVRNSTTLINFRREGFSVDVRFYDVMPHFRITVIDGNFMIVGLYSYISDTGEDSPQIILDGSPRAWSFFYGFNAYAESLWLRSTPAEATITEYKNKVGPDAWKARTSC